MFQKRRFKTAKSDAPLHSPCPAVCIHCSLTSRTSSSTSYPLEPFLPTLNNSSSESSYSPFICECFLHMLIPTAWNCTHPRPAPPSLRSPSSFLSLSDLPLAVPAFSFLHEQDLVLIFCSIYTSICIVDFTPHGNKGQVCVGKVLHFSHSS